MYSTLSLCFFPPSFLACYLPSFPTSLFPFSPTCLPLSFPPSVNNGCSINATDYLLNDKIAPKVRNTVLLIFPLLPPRPMLWSRLTPFVPFFFFDMVQGF